MHDAGFPTTSIDTNGSSAYSKIPFNSPSAAFLKAAFTTSSVTEFGTRATKSVNDPPGVETRTATPPSLPSNHCLLSSLQPLKPQKMPDPKVQGETILVVEDVPEVLTVHTNMLENRSYQTLTRRMQRTGSPGYLRSESGGRCSGADKHDHARNERSCSF